MTYSRLKAYILLVSVLVMMLLTACTAGGKTITPTPTDAVTPTSTPVPTDTPTPTNTPIPTDTPTPTPTETPTPTNTPTPTATNTPAPTKAVKPDPDYGPVPTSAYPQVYADVTDASAEKTHKFKRIIFYGDSRFAMMKNDIVGMIWQGTIKKSEFPKISESDFVAKIDAHYDWMRDHQEDVFKKYGEDTLILIEFGVNDLHMVDKYIAFANELIDAGYNVGYLTIMPVVEDKALKYGYSLSNKNIIKFNDKLKTDLNPRAVILDAYDYLMQTGFETIDGLHFKKETTEIELYKFIVNSLRAE